MGLVSLWLLFWKLEKQSPVLQPVQHLCLFQHTLSHNFRRGFFDVHTILDRFAFLLWLALSRHQTQLSD